MIRRVEPDDWELLRGVRLRALQCDPDAFLSTYARESAFDHATWQERAGQRDGASFVAAGLERADGLATGLVTDDPATAILVGMWVAPELRGTGVANELVASVLAWARSRGCARVVLSVEGDNHRAAKLYERCGFYETDEASALPYEPNEGNRFFVFEL